MINQLNFPFANAMSATVLFNQIIAKIPPEAVARNLGLHPNTVRRWIERGDVPPEYVSDFKRMQGVNGDAKDQFYTKKKVARHCYKQFLSVARELGVNTRRYTFIEPAAGCGYFYQALPPQRRYGIDLMPNSDEIEKADYLRWSPDDGRGYIVIGNPPFGLRGHLALQFINHSAPFADMVAFILPQLFESDGKGVPSKRVDKRYSLAHSERLASDSFVKPDGTPVNISTIFQVWTKIKCQNIKKAVRKSCRSFIKVYSLSNGGTPASTRNKDMIGRCNLYLPSTCFGGMKAYRSFDELPHRRGYGIVIHKNKRQIKSLMLSHNWDSTAFISTNGARNLRSSLIEDVIMKRGFYDE